MEWRPLQLCNMLAPGMRLNSEGPVSPLNFLPYLWASEGPLLTVIRSQWQSPCSHPLPLLGGLADNHCDLRVAGQGSHRALESLEACILVLGWSLTPPGTVGMIPTLTGSLKRD